MIIEQPEAFKTWLTAVLKPMCDADPAALAKYVLALIKKDKSEQELQKIMVGQLEVFLEAETESFVSLVLRTLETQEYINTPVIPNANPPNPAAVATKPKEVVVPPPVVVALKSPPVAVVEAVAEQQQQQPSGTGAVNGAGVQRKEHEVKRDRELRKSDNVLHLDRLAPKPINKEEKTTARPTTRTRHRSSSRNRSRSRSWDRSKRSKSRERERDKRPRTWRNKSPPRRFDRRGRSRTPSPAPLRGRSRSPKHQRPRYRNRTPPRGGAGSPLGGGDRSRSRSRSPRSSKLSPDSRLGKDAAGHHSRPGTPTQDSNHGDMDLRLTNSTQSIQSIVQQQQGAGGPSSASSKRRCRDFDEKGYCMRGEMCPFDHGVDPVVLEDTQLSSVLSYNPNAGPPGDVVGVTPIAGAPLLNAPPGVGHPLMGGGPRAMGAEYNPQAPQMWNRPPGFRGPRPPMGMPRGPTMGGFPPPPNHQRELIPVPVMDSKQGGNGHGHGGHQHHHHHHHPYMVPGMGPGGGHPGNFRPQYSQGGGGPMMGGGGMGDPHDLNNLFKKKQFDFNRLGPRSKNPMNCSLELKKVPTGLNSITHLNNHFCKFGKTVNIQVNYEGDPEAALVTFSSHAEANAAYRSTEAVLNNRFIKVFWHNGNEGKQENVPPRSVKDRLGVPGIVAPNTNKVLNLVQPKADSNDNVVDAAGVGEANNGEDKGDKTASDPQAAAAPPVVTRNKEETKAQEAAAIKKGQELLAVKEKLKKNQEEQRKEVMRIKNDLRKKKQELLEKQLTQQKMLIEKMEKVPQGPQRDELMVTIKKTQESIESIKKDLLQSVLTVKAPPQKKAKEDVQREVLDAELDLITKQQEGADTSEIQKRLQELKARAGMTRGGRGGGRGGGTRRFTPHGRHLMTKNNLIDNASGLKGNVKTVTGASKPTTAPFQKHTVDHRPTRLLVSGYETDEQESVLQHFQTFGEIVHFVTDLTLPSITLNYKTRKEAEMALLKGKHFQDRTLSITWCTIAPPLTPRSTPRKSLLSESEEDQLIDQSLQDGEEDVLGPEISEEALLQDDEEEDEENEDRSWRR